MFLDQNSFPKTKLENPQLPPLFVPLFPLVPTDNITPQVTIDEIKADVLRVFPNAIFNTYDGIMWVYLPATQANQIYSYLRPEFDRY